MPGDEELRTPAGDGEVIETPPLPVVEQAQETEEVEQEVTTSDVVTPLSAIEEGLRTLEEAEMPANSPEPEPMPLPVPVVEEVLPPPAPSPAPLTAASAPVQQPAVEPAPITAVEQDPASAPEPTRAIDPGKVAAEALATEYRKLPGIVAGLIGGGTVEEVTTSLEAAKKAYGDVKAQVLKELGTNVPSARGGAGPAPVPATPLGMIEAGLETTRYRQRKN